MALVLYLRKCLLTGNLAPELAEAVPKDTANGNNAHSLDAKKNIHTHM